MGKEKNTFLAYADWIDIFESLSDEEAGLLVKHMFRYVNDQDPAIPNRIIELSFVPIRASLKRDLKKWEKITGDRKSAGSKGGKQKQANLTNGSKPKQKVANVANVPDSDSDSDSERGSMPFFDQFYISYGKKVSKGKAIAAFNRLSRRDQVLAIEAVSDFKRWTLKEFGDMKYLPYPATYLNQKRWEDEGIVVPEIEVLREKGQNRSMTENIRFYELEKQTDDK